MAIQVGAGRLAGDGSGNAIVSVIVLGRKRPIRVTASMQDGLVLAVTPTGNTQLIHPQAFKECRGWVLIPDVDPSSIKQILTVGREVMSDPKLQAGARRAIQKRQERERKERVTNYAVRVQGMILGMLKAGATSEEVMICVNEALVKTVQEV